MLRDRRAINERFDELQAGIKQEILVFTKPPYATPPQEEVVGLGVSRTHEARSVYEYSVFNDPDVSEGVRRFIEAGERARFVPDPPLKLVIIDESIVMFGMEDPVAGASELTIMVVEHPSLCGRAQDRVRRRLGARLDVRRGARAARQLRVGSHPPGLVDRRGRAHGGAK